MRRRPLTKKISATYRSHRCLHSQCAGVRSSRECCLRATLSLCVPTWKGEKMPYSNRQEYALNTGIVSASIRTDSPGVVGHKRDDPIDYQAEINVPGALGWRTSMLEEAIQSWNPM